MNKSAGADLSANGLAQTSVENAAGSRFFEDYFDELRRRLGDIGAHTLDELCTMLVNTRERSKKVILAGNGGSAAIASHVAVDMTKMLGLRAINFNEADLITCLANDYGYANWVAQAIEFYADPGDLAVLISSSGQSANIVNGAERARKLGLDVVTLTGFRADNPLRSAGNLNLWVNSKVYNVIETTHQAWLLAAVDKIAVDGVAGG